MNKRDLQLLSRDICSRLPYGVTVLFNNTRCVVENIGRDGSISLIRSDIKVEKAIYLTKVNFVKPYLRPINDITDEEIDIIWKIYEDNPCSEGSSTITDLLNEWHIDHHHLIEKGLAIAVTEENNPYKS